MTIICYACARFDAALLTAQSSLYSMAQLVLAYMWGIISDRYGRKQLILMSNTFSTASMLMFGLAGNYTVAAAARILGGAYASCYNADLGSALDVFKWQSQRRMAGGPRDEEINTEPMAYQSISRIIACCSLCLGCLPAACKGHRVCKTLWGAM